MKTKVLVGIPTLNGPDRLDRLLRSIRESGSVWQRYDMKCVVVDDCSTPENTTRNQELIDRYYTDLKSYMGLEIVRNDSRRGIATSWNRAVSGDPLADACVLLNDDVEVMPDWLDVLVFSVMSNPHAGMVALNSYVALTRAQHLRALRAGAPSETDFTPAHALLPRIDYVESKLMGGDTLLASSGAAFAFRREVWLEAQGFDERYFCFYEELDFGTTLRAKGYRHYIASHPVIYHMGGATNSDRRNLDANVEMEKSRAVYREKWAPLGGTPSAVRKYLATASHYGILADEMRARTREWNSSLRNVDE